MSAGVTLSDMQDLARRESDRLDIHARVYGGLADTQARDQQVFQALDRFIDRVQGDAVIMGRLKSAVPK